MTPFVSDPDFTLYVGDALEVLRTLPAESVHCCVTSPPYWGLRDYGTGQWEGGDPDCDHSRHVDYGEKSDTNRGSIRGGPMGQVCDKCGATRVDRQLGLEATPDEFVAAMVDVFREVRRVLRADGTLWLNLGDSYNSSAQYNGHKRKDRSSSELLHSGKRYSERGHQTSTVEHSARAAGTAAPDVDGSAFGVEPQTWPGHRTFVPGLKPKDLVGIPWRVAFALQADGWYLRSDIIWAKPNPMPESVTDRPTKAHEQIFLLAKGQWKARVVALSDLHSEGVHVGNHVGAKDANVWAHEFGVRLATAILDGAQLKQDLGLPPLDAEVWQKRPGDVGGVLVADLPVEHRAAVYAARLLSANAPAKEFMCELDRLGVALTDRNHFTVGGSATEFLLPPGVDRYGERAIAIHDAGEIGEVDFVAHTLKFSRPVGCSYFFDQEAVREAYQPSSIERAQYGRDDIRTGTVGHLRDGMQKGVSKNGAPLRHDLQPHPSGRNIRSVWEIATQPFPEAHFATFPEALPDRCIRAGSSERGCCPECGAPWERTTERVDQGYDGSRYGERAVEATGGAKTGGTARSTLGSSNGRLTGKTETTGWQPSCQCGGTSAVPCTVLDPFMGSGTTALVARRLGRRSIGIELNPEYAALAARRLQQLSLFAEAAS